jgi:Rps23 Pro-64 3,4-dihydroxylase Tpa1-like proline 4-hydroxylase
LSAAVFDVDQLERNSGELSAEFAAGRPFPHLVVDDLLRIEPNQAQKFPDITWDRWNELGDRYQHNKRACSDIEAIPEPFADLIRELSEPRFLRALEKITGIEQLLPDPYLAGGGLHLSGPGGILSPHTDFHYHRALNLYRRINVLIYLNEGWTLSDGGCLSLYDGDNPVQTVVPNWGRMVVFRTDDKSVHGFPVPVADGKWRRSVALYYYTAAPTPGFSGDETTYWREHGEQRSPVHRVRFVLYRALLNLSRGISILAHIVNPNQGLGLVRTVLANRRKNASRR